MSADHLTLILHAHLPYVLTHGRWPHGLDWLNEAAAESYVPLLRVLDGLAADGISSKLTVTLTPILLEQLADPVFPSVFSRYLQERVDAAREDEREFSRVGDQDLRVQAVRWERHFREILRLFQEVYRGDLVGAFRRLSDHGQIEILTSAATHAYLPLLGFDDNVHAQLAQGAATSFQRLGRAPRGIWLPECAYRPRTRWIPPVSVGPLPGPIWRKGLEEFLSERGLTHFVADTHLLRGGEAVGVYGDRFEAVARLRSQPRAEPARPEDPPRNPYSLYWVAGTPPGGVQVALFTRDSMTGAQVWSGERGYPGDEGYLEFHKRRFPGGHRYWRVTVPRSDLAEKAEYDPDAAARRVETHARHFVEMVKTILGEARSRSHRAAVLCAPYDAELFGHWWHEGPLWLDRVLRLLAVSSRVEAVTMSEALTREPPVETVSLPEGSWGEGGRHQIWLNEATGWIWEQIYDAEAKMRCLARRVVQGDPLLDRLLRQAGRELLLLESSDWPFLVTTQHAKDYALLRVTEHADRFRRLAALAEQVGGGGLLSPDEEKWLADVESQDRPFRQIDPRWFWSLV